MMQAFPISVSPYSVWGCRGGDVFALTHGFASSCQAIVGKYSRWPVGTALLQQRLQLMRGVDQVFALS